MTKQSNNIPQKTENQGVPVPFYAGYSQAYSDDEISLVDLAKILIRNWWVVIVSVLACAALAWIAAPKMPSYDYVSLIASGINEENEPIESNAAVEAQLSNVFLPRVTREFLAENSELDKLGFRVEVDSLRETDIVRLTSTATYERSDDVEIVHQRLVQEVVDRQTQLIETLRSRIESRIEQLETTMGNQVSEEVRSELRLELAEQHASLMTLEGPNLLALAEQSLEPTGRSSLFYLALGLIGGLMLGVVGAFFWEFALKVRESIHEDAAQKAA